LHEFQPTDLIQPLTDLIGADMMAADVELASGLEGEKIIGVADPDQFVQQAFNLTLGFGRELADGEVTENGFPNAHKSVSFF